MTATATPFDFTTPRRISPHGQLALRDWQEMLCASATEAGRSLLDGPFDWKIETIETHKTRDTLSSLTDQHVMHHIAVASESVNTLCYWEQSAAVGVVASLLGSSAVPPPRGLTVVEQAVLELVLDLWARAFTATWPIAGSMDAVFSRVSNTRFAAKLFERVEDVVAIQYSLTTALGGFATHWIVPKSFLEEHLACVPDDGAGAGETEPIEMLVGDIPVSIAVELGRKTVPLSRIRSLQEHDVIVLDQSIYEPLRIRVEGTVKMSGLPGRSDNRQIIKIVSMSDD